MRDEGQNEGPFRESAKPPDPSTPWSYTALASLPLVVAGWSSLWVFAQGTEWMIFVCGFLLFSGGACGALGLIETKPPPPPLPPLDPEPEAPPADQLPHRSLPRPPPQLPPDPGGSCWPSGSTPSPPQAGVPD